MRFVIQESDVSFNGGESRVVEAPSQAAAEAFGRSCGYNDWGLREPTEEERSLDLPSTRNVTTRAGEEVVVHYR